MIDTQLEKFTSKAAVDAGLIDAIKRGEVKINGAYELTPDGKIISCSKTNGANCT